MPEGEKTISSAEVSLGQDFSASFVEKIDIQKGEDANQRVIFAKKASGEWTIENRYGALARKSNVESLLNVMHALTGDLRSEDEAVLGDFSLKDEQAIHVNVYGPDN